MMTSHRPRLTSALFGSLAAILCTKVQAQNWERVSNGLPANARIQAIAGDASLLAIGVGLPTQGIGIYVSSDHGDSWTPTAAAPSGPIYADSNTLLVDGDTLIASRLLPGELLRSADKGASWQRANGLPADAGVVSLVKDGGTYYAQLLVPNGSGYGPYRSTDGGATWSAAFTGLTGIPQNVGALKGRVFSSQLQSGLWSSSNQGSSWSRLLPEIGGSNFPPCRMISLPDRLLVGVSGQLAPSVIAVLEGSDTWQAADAGLASTFSERDFAASAPAVFVGGQNGSAPSVWQSLDRGATWVELTAQGLSIAPSSVAPVSSLWVHGDALFASVVSVSGTNGFFRLRLNGGKYDQAPTIVTNPVSQIAGAGQSASFSVTAFGQGPLTYQWYSNNVIVPGATSSVLTLSGLSTNAAASYSVKVGNAHGTNTSASATLTVLPVTPGNFDFTFNSLPMGKASGTLVFGGAVNAVAIQPDGRVLAAGDFNRIGATLGTFLTGGTVCSNIARYLPNGALDDTFQFGTGANAPIKAMAIQPDGKILIGGQFTAYRDVASVRLARLNPDGSPDTAFSAAGTGFNGDVLAIVVQADNKILVGGNFTTAHGSSRKYLARLLPTGELDPTFLNGLAGPANAVNALAWKDDRIYLGGKFTTVNATTRNRIARLMPDGVIDTTFDPAAGFDSDVNGIAVQPDGRILAVGAFTSFRGTTSWRLARITATGALDFAIGSAMNAIAYAVTLQPDGKFVVGGNFDTVLGASRKRIVRFNGDFTVDASFDPGTGIGPNVSCLALQADGQLVVGGTFTTVNGMNRYLLTRVFAAPLALPPPVLRYSLAGGTMQLSWDGPFLLQSNGVAGPTGWQTFPTSSPALLPTSTAAAGFFRLISPP